MVNSHELAGLLLVFAAAFIVTLIATPLVGRLTAHYGKTGRDVHKPSELRIPEMCGLAIILGLAATVIGSVQFASLFTSEAAAFIGTVLVAAAIGFVDDLHPLGARTKPILTALACVPILLLGTYYPYPAIPLLGRVRLTIIYPFLIPLAIAVTSNTVNMIDVMNGSMTGTVSIISATVMGLLVFQGQIGEASLAGGLSASLLAFHYFNRYPAKVFSGDTGSLAVGAAVGAISVLGRMEAVMVVAMIPLIMNAFYGLSSVGRFYEHREISSRPVKVLEDGTLTTSSRRDAPVTLARIILASGPLSEKSIVSRMMLLTLVSSVLAVLTFSIILLGKI